VATFVKHKVFMTPLAQTGEYGTRTEVTNLIDVSGVSSIKRSIDAGDFDFAIYQYDHITLKGINRNGFFNDETDSRSIFPAGRDLAKCEVEFIEVDNSDGTETTKVTFFGLINEESTRIEPVKDEIKLRVLSRDSVIRNTKISAGAVPNGALVSTALKTILNTARITSVLGFDVSKINPDLDFTIDDGSVFTNRNTRTALNQLLLASNSIFVIDSNDDMVIKSRAESGVTTINLFGKDDIHGRENIVTLKKYNTGRHRVFTSVLVNNSEASDSDLAGDIGFRQKKVSLDFITTAAQAQLIADRLLLEFKAPKIELEVSVKTSLVKNSDLLDRFSINYPLRIKPQAGKFMPIVNTATIDDAETPLPDTFGSLIIDDNLAFKVIQIRENTKEFLTVLKLRQLGTTISDGVFV